MMSCTENLMAVIKVSVVKEGKTEAVLSEFGDGPLGGHSGINKTSDAIKQHYRWPNMVQDVTVYVSFDFDLIEIITFL